MVFQSWFRQHCVLCCTFSPTARDPCPVAPVRPQCVLCGSIESRPEPTHLACFGVLTTNLQTTTAALMTGCLIITKKENVFQPGPGIMSRSQLVRSTMYFNGIIFSSEHPANMFGNMIPIIFASMEYSESRFRKCNKKVHLMQRQRLESR